MAKFSIFNRIFNYMEDLEKLSNETLELAKRLKETFDKTYEAPQVVWNQFASLCTLKTFKKNTIIKRGGSIEKNGYFILSGSAGVFVWKEDSYVCLDIMFEEDFFGDSMSLNTGLATPIETMAIENCEMLQISLDNIIKLKETEFGKILFLQAAEMDFVNKQKQQIDLLLKTAEERYIELVSKNPKIILRIPQKHIASYLGITNQSLSRIRKKISDQNS